MVRQKGKVERKTTNNGVKTREWTNSTMEIWDQWTGRFLCYLQETREESDTGNGEEVISKSEEGEWIGMETDIEQGMRKCDWNANRIDMKRKGKERKGEWERNENKQHIERNTHAYIHEYITYRERRKKKGNDIIVDDSDD